MRAIRHDPKSHSSTQKPCPLSPSWHWSPLDRYSNSRTSETASRHEHIDHGPANTSTRVNGLNRRRHERPGGNYRQGQVYNSPNSCLLGVIFAFCLKPASEALHSSLLIFAKHTLSFSFQDAYLLRCRIGSCRCRCCRPRGEAGRRPILYASNPPDGTQDPS